MKPFLLSLVFIGTCVCHGQQDIADRTTPISDISIFQHKENNGLALPKNGEVAGSNQERKLYAGTVKNYLLHGDWQSWYQNGHRLDSGYLTNGIPDGTWKVWDSAGQLLSIRTFSSDKLQRVVQEIKINHPRKRFFALSNLYASDRRKALLLMHAKSAFEYNPRAFSSLEQLVLHNNTPGNYQPLFLSCLMHGVSMNFFAGHIVKDSGHYKDGLKDGVWLHRNSIGGSYFMGAYKNGNRYSEWKHYDPHGRLIELIMYDKNGLEKERKKYR